MEFSKISPRIFFLCALAFIVGWRVFLFFFGFDLLDTGWMQHSYQQIFTAPASVEYNFLYYFSDLLGGVWEAIFPNAGIIGGRVLGLLLLMATVVLIYRMLRGVFHPKALSLAFVLCCVFASSFPYFNHHPLTTFLTVSAIALLMKGLLRGNALFTAGAGALLVLNSFTRIPNSAVFALVALIPAAVFFQDGTRKETRRESCQKLWRALLAFAAGAGAALCAILFTMLVLGHLNIFLNALTVMGKIAEDDNASTHSLANILRFNIGSLEVAFPVNAVFVALALTQILVFSFARRISRPAVRIPLMVFSVLLLAALSVFYLNPLQNHLVLILYFAAGVPIVARLVWILNERAHCESGQRATTEEFLLLLAALIVMATFPIGSDFGVFNMGRFALWFTFPIGFAILVRHFLCDLKLTTGAGARGFTISRNVFRLAAACLFASVFLVLLRRGTIHFANDVGSVFEKKSRIESELARGVFTGEEVAQNTNGLLAALWENGVRAGDALLCYDSVPTIHYLTRTRPFAQNAWPLVYSPALLKHKLLLAEKNAAAAGAAPPVVVMQRKEKMPRWLLPLHNIATDADAARDAIMRDFLRSNHYHRCWQNKWFEVWRSTAWGKQKAAGG
ncbi:MAG: hypothetical protein LBR07_08455 [Puniceicoccales bacterium]|jgi:hypothetical protein|nr:hypothetical protein [Puniceicoccales bacterium]